MMLSFFFLMNLVLSSVVLNYAKVKSMFRNRTLENARQNLKKAFEVLDHRKTGRIRRRSIEALFRILNEDFPEFRYLSPEDEKLFFAILDKGGQSTITEAEFLDLANVLGLYFVKKSQYATFVERCFPTFFQSDGYQRFCRTIQSPQFESTIDVILVMNALVIGIQSYPELSGKAVSINPNVWDGVVDTLSEYAETVFTVLYIVEVCMKLIVLGWRNYFASRKNLFDFTITVLAVVSTL